MDKNSLYRFFEGQASIEEMKAVKEWAESSEEHSKQFHRERKLFNAMILIGNPKWTAINTTKRNRYFIREFLKIASVIIIAVSITATIFSITNEHHKHVDIAMQTIIVPAGQRVNIELPDGSNVWLNAGTQMQYPVSFMKDKREVILDGEAYFEVIADTKRPFYVQVGEVKIQVLGTAFNVSAYREDQQVEVALLRGKVGLDLPGNEYVLAPGEIATWNKGDRQATLRKGDVESIVDWKTGRFNFEDMSLDKLTVKLARWYGVQFIFEDETTKEFRFSGAVTKYRTLDYVLGMIVKTTKVAFQEKDGKILVRKIE